MSDTWAPAPRDATAEWLTEHDAILCDHCGSEGRLYSGHPNDPHPRDIGECPTCKGSGALIPGEPK